MQQIYRRTPMLKYDFNKATKQLDWNGTSACVFSCKFAAYFQNIFYKEQLWVVASVTSTILLFGVFLRRETITTLRQIAVNFV